MTPPIRSAPNSGGSPVFAATRAAATSHPLASTTAREVLEAGGNAIDAAVSAAAVLNVVEPHMTGLGGDMFALVWIASDGKLHALDASGRSGSLMTAEALAAKGRDKVPERGPESVTVPGALSGWVALLDRFGSMSLAQALAPAIRIAEKGFHVTPIIAGQWRRSAPDLHADPGARATFLFDDTRGPEEGEWFANADLAQTLRRVAEEGSSTFYGGSLGREICDGLKRLGGYITLDDLTTHRVRWVDPISADFHGNTVWQIPPAGQGIAALQMLRILEGFDLEQLGHNSVAYLHHLIEAKKVAFADLHAHVADADHMRATVVDMLDRTYLDSRRALIDPTRAATHPDPDEGLTAGETICLSVTDAEGNMVSLINSIFAHFGSGVVIPGTGFALQNRGAGFTLREGHPNRVAPGKRPLHTIIPGFVTRDGAPWMAFGLMGGSMQPQGHVQFLANLFVFGMNVQEAIDAPRFRHLDGLRVALEAAVPTEVRDGLRELGHHVVEQEDIAFGGAQAIARHAGGWVAGSDPRKDGVAVGD